MASNHEDSSAARQMGKQQSSRQQEGSTQKTRKKARDRGQAKENLTPNAENTPPSTPAKSAKSNNTNAPATEGQASKQPKRKGNQGARGSTPTPETTVTPPPAKPVQIYAGPTFHASPAPSSLPIPKMFSKSMPQGNDRDANLRSMLQSEASGNESSEAEGSPSMRNALLPQARGAREESPLDILFRADKEEKARRHASASQSSLVTPTGQPRASSTSPGPGSGGPGRPPTDGAMFSLEMDNAPRPASSRLEDSPSVPARSHDLRAADAQAKTEALKSLLRFQGPNQRPASASHSLTSSRSSSTPPTAPPPFAHSASDTHLPSSNFPKHAYPAPQYHPQQQQQQRSNTRQSSQLRQQLDAVANEHYPPTSSSPRAWPADNPHMAQHQRPYGTHPHAPPPYAGSSGGSHRASPGPPPAFGPHDALRASLGQHHQPPLPPASAPPQAGAPTSNEAMEEQLRRILKLDSLPNAGVHT